MGKFDRFRRFARLSRFSRNFQFRDADSRCSSSKFASKRLAISWTDRVPLMVRCTMRNGWLVLASLLFCGKAAQAQQYPIGSPAALEQAQFQQSLRPAATYQPAFGIGPSTTAPSYSSRFPTFGATAMPLPPQPVGVGPAFFQTPTDPSAAPTPRPTPDAVPNAAPQSSSVYPGEPTTFHRNHDESFWLKGQFVVARFRNGPLDIPLVTAGIASNPNPGAISPANPGTRVLFGGNGLNFSELAGFRAEAGLWLDLENRYSADISAMVISPGNVSFTAGSNEIGIPVIARPFYNARIDAERSFLTSFPGALSGVSRVDAQSDFWSLELNARRHAYWYEHLHAEALIGVRTATLREDIQIQDNLTDINGGFLLMQGVPLNAGDRLLDQDLFRTVNRFYGLQVGSAITADFALVDASFFAKLGVGVVERFTTIEGVTAAVSPGLGNPVAPGGILAQVTNMGDRRSYAFSLLPEFGANLGYNVTPHVRISAGYSFLMMTNVIRPGDLINRSVNDGLPPSSQNFGLPGPAQPGFISRDSLFYLQTVNVGLEFHY
jgi:hypothetical protein